MVIYGKYFGPILNMILRYSAGKQILFSFNGQKTKDRSRKLLAF